MIVSMNKIALLGMEEQRETLINSLMELGAVEISSIDETEYEEIASHPVTQDELTVIEGKLSDVHAALDSLNKYSPEKKGMFYSRCEISASEFSSVLKNQAEVWSSVKKVREHEQSLTELRAEENRLNNLYHSLLPWKDLLSPLEVTGTKKTGFLLGTIPGMMDWKQIEEEFQEKVSDARIYKINSDKDQHYVYVIYHYDMEQDSLSYLKSRGFNRVSFSGLLGTAEENLKRLEVRTNELTMRREEIIEKIIDIKKSRRSMEILYDALNMEKSRTLVMGKVLKTRRVFFIMGWIPERNAVSAKEWLEGKYTVSVDIRKPEDGEEFPVLLENRGIAKAAEPVMNMYGVPNSREIDPNAIMAPFFILFFGLMLSDGGYGLIMVLLSAFIQWRFKLEENTKKFMKLMMYCGFSTIFWGAMFGGWFGISVLAPYALWFNMVEEPELMLSWSLLFGIIHMFVGIGVKGVNLIRRKKYLDALFDAGFWFVVFTGFVLFLLPFAPRVDPIKTAPLVNVGKYLLVIGAVLLILTQGRKKKNPVLKFFGGISSLYDLIGFFSDVLSYSRLLALGLATSIIASIVNQMSVMFDLPGVIKVILAIVILLVGHGINFAINALGAYVHSCRLQYLEFFGKFFKGGGEAFKPLKPKTKYIYVKPNTGI